MYPEVKGEMARKNITLAMIANDPRVDCTVSTLRKRTLRSLRPSVRIRSSLRTPRSLN